MSKNTSSYKKTERQNQSARRTGSVSGYKKTERQNQSARRTGSTGTGSKTTGTSSKSTSSYTKTARQNQSARRTGSTGTITNSKGQKTTNQTTLTRQQLLNAVTGSTSPMGHLKQTAETKNKGVTKQQVTQQAKATLPGTVTKALDRQAQQSKQTRQEKAKTLQKKLEQTTDRRQRAAYRQEITDLLYPLSQADRKLSTVKQQKLQEAKKAWAYGDSLEKQGKTKQGQAWKEYGHGLAESTRGETGYSGGAAGDEYILPELTGKDRYLTDTAKTQLRGYKLYYDRARKSGDQEGMDAAAAAARELRQSQQSWDRDRAEESYHSAAALLARQSLYDRTGGQKGLRYTAEQVKQARQTVAELEEALPELGRGALSRVGLTLKGAGENTLGSLAEAAGWLLTPAADGRNYRSRATGDWVNPAPLEQAANDLYSQSDKLLRQSSEDLSAAKFGLGKLGDVAVDVGAFGAQMVPEIALGAVTGGVGGLAAMGARAFGGGAYEARQSGASYARQGLYGLASAATEVATEKLFSVAAPFRRAYGGSLRAGGKSLDEALVNALNKVTRNETAAHLIASASTEGLEEVIADAVNPVLRSLYNGQTPAENYSTEQVSDWLYSGMIGSILGGLGGVTGQAVTRRTGSGQESTPTPTLDETRTAPTLDQTPTPEQETAGQDSLRRAAEERVAGQSETRQSGQSAAEKLAAYRTGWQAQQTAQAQQNTQTGRTAAEKLAAYRASQQTDQSTQSAEESAQAEQARRDTLARQRLTQAGAQLGEHGRKALTAAYESGTDTADYFGGFSVLYEAGKAGKSARSVQSSLVQSLTPAQKLAAYVAGQNDSKLVQADSTLTQAGSGRTAGLVRTRAAEQLDPTTAQRLDDLGKALDTPIHVREDTGAGVNGWYDRQLGRIVVSAGDGNSTMTVAKHEITHRMQDLAPKEYAVYRDYAARILGGEAGTARLTAAYQERYARAGVELSEEEALDEAAADFTQAMTEDPALFRRLAQSKPGAARQLVEAVKTFLRKIKAVFQGSKRRQDQAAAETYGVTVRQLEKAARLWEQALQASARTARTKKATEARQGNGGKRYSIDPDFGGQIDAWNGKSGKTFRVGRTSAALQSIGVKDRTIIWHSGKIAKILAKHKGMTRDVIKQVPEILEDPVIVLTSKKSKSRIVMFGEATDSNGDPVTAILELQPTGMGGEIMDMNVIASAYGKDSSPAGFIRSSGVLYLDPDKTRTERWLHSIGLQLPSGLTTLGSIGSITYQDGKVKMESIPAEELVELSGEGLPQGRGSADRRYSIDPDFGGRIAAWDREGRPEGARFTLGSTGPVLQGLGAIESDIYMNGDKIRKILHDHPEMTLREIQRIPEILEDPVLVLKSRNAMRGARGNTRMVLFGSIKARDGRPILCVLDLRPREGGFLLDNMQKVTSAYTKDTNPTAFVQNSDVMFLDKKRTTRLLSEIGFQMPISCNRSGYIGIIAYARDTVKLEGKPFSQVVELSGESGEKLSLAGENLLEAEARAKALEKENEILRARVERWKNQTRQTEVPAVDRAEVRRQARALLKRYQGTLTTDELAPRLQDLYDRMTQSEHLSWDAAYQEARIIARELAESAVVLNDGLYQEYTELRQYLRTTPLRISEEESHDIPDYNDWRKHYLGKVRIGKGRTNVDQVYRELSQLWPEFFPAEEADAAPVAPSDQLLHIASVADSLYTITEENPYGGRMEQITSEIANDVMATFFEVPQARKTFADRQQAKLDAAIAEGRQRTRQAVAAEREVRKREIKQIRDKYWDKRHEDAENRTAAELRGRILRHTQKLSQKLLRPTDKQHIPEQMRFAVAGVLDSINLTSAYVIDKDTGKRKKGAEGDPVKMTEKWLELKHAYETIQKERAGMDNWVIDPDLMENLNELARLGNLSIMKMSRAQLVTVWNTLQAVEASVLSQDKAFGKARFATISEAAAALRTENRGKREHKSLRGPLGELSTNMMTPQAFFHRLGEAGENIFRMLRGAQDEYITLLDGAQKKTGELLNANKAKVKAWEKEKQSFTLESGEKLTLTTAQMMSLYELMKRPQAREHILLGGIRPENAPQGLRDTTPAKPIHLSFGDCVQISLKLTEAQRNTADALQQYMAKDLAAEGNRASLSVYGYEKFKEKHYFPIHVDRNQVARDNAQEAKARTIAEKGMTKGTIPKANNAVMLDSVFTVYAKHVNEMLTYAAWLGPMENLKRIQNYTYKDEEGHRTGTVRDVIERVFGRTGNDYLNQLADDLNQGVPVSDTGNIFGRVTGNVKVASVSANIRVFAQQPSAVLRALDMVNPADFALGLTRARPGTWKKVMQYAPIARWKDWGYFDVHTGRQVRNVLLNDDKVTDRIKEALIAPAGALDSLSWSGLWNALETETRRKRRDLTPGSTAFYEAVAERFSEVVDRTQVVDGILQRSQFMRKPDGLTKAATVFMAEPTKTYNQFLGAVYDLRTAQKPKARAEAIRGLGKTCFALTASIVVNATVGRALIDALRDDDDDESYWEKYRQALTGLEGDEAGWKDKLKGLMGGDLVSDFLPWNYIPFVKDVASILEGYSAKQMDMDSISKFIQAAAKALKSLGEDGELTRKNAVLNLLGAAGRMTGWPVANIKRDIEAVYRTWLNGRGDLEGIYEMNRFLYAMNESNKNKFLNLAARAKEQGNDALLDRIEADLRAALPELSAEDFDQGIDKQIKKRVQATEDYTATQQGILQPLLDHLAESETYGKLSDEQKEYVRKTLESYAKGKAAYEASDGEVMPGEAVEKLMGLANAGMDVADYVTLKALTKDITSLKNVKTGKTIDNSKSVLIRKAVEESGIALDEDLKDGILELLGVGEKIRNIPTESFLTYTVKSMENRAQGKTSAGDLLDSYNALSAEEQARLTANLNSMDVFQQASSQTETQTASQRSSSDDGTYHYGLVGAYVNSNYGYRTHPITGKRTFHYGVDIPAATGTSIGASRSGTVIEVGYTNARGNYLKVQHDDGLVTLYQHCDSILAQKGDTVAQDQTIATVGSTGKVTGPHLHLEVWKNGKAVDPMDYLGK